MIINPTSNLTARLGRTEAAPKDTFGASFFFNADNLDDYHESLGAGLRWVREQMRSVDKPFSGVLPEELVKAFEGLDLDRPLENTETALRELKTLYLDHAVYFHHPKYVAHLNCPVVIPAILAELILTSVNSSLDTWDQSAGGTLIEQSLIDWTNRKIGLGAAADGIFTSGGTQSNLMALLLARDSYAMGRLEHDIRRKGLPADAGRFRLFTSEVSHFSVRKAAALLGLGHDAVVSVPCDGQFRMDVPRLEFEIRECMAQGCLPIGVVATAGSTDFGSIDPLPEIASVCERHGLWMHVDAAYGSGLLLSLKNRDLLNGIERADSVTVDYHKSFFQPVSCSAFLVRDRDNLSYVTHHAEYLNPLSEWEAGTPDLVNKSLQTTRRFDSLKLWLTLRIMGADSVGAAFDRVMGLAQATYVRCQREPDIELIHEPELSTLVFRYRPAEVDSEEALDALNVAIRRSLIRSGEAILAKTKVGGRQFLKFTLLNPSTPLEEIEEILELIQHHGRRHLERRAAPDALQPLSC